MMPLLKLQIRTSDDQATYLSEPIPSPVLLFRAWIMWAFKFLAGCLVTGVGLGLMLAGCQLVTRSIP